MLIQAKADAEKLSVEREKNYIDQATQKEKMQAEINLKREQFLHQSQQKLETEKLAAEARKEQLRLVEERKREEAFHLEKKREQDRIISDYENQMSLKQKLADEIQKNAIFRKEKEMQIETRWLYCVECPQYSTRRRSASDTHRSGMLCYVKTGL